MLPKVVITLNSWMYLRDPAKFPLLTVSRSPSDVKDDEGGVIREVTECYIKRELLVLSAALTDYCPTGWFSHSLRCYKYVGTVTLCALTLHLVPGQSF